MQVKRLGPDGRPQSGAIDKLKQGIRKIEGIDGVNARRRAPQIEFDVNGFEH